MTVEKVTTVSWFGRLKNSIAGIGFGFLLVIGITVGLFWNEGRAVQTQRSLDEGAGLVVSLTPDIIDPAYEGQLIHVTGPITADHLVSDDQFAVTAEGVRLVRSVEMFQWIETSKTETQQNLGGSETRVTTYSYGLDWSDRHHDSSRFEDAGDHHQNPAMVYERRSFSLDSAELGAFLLGRTVLDRVGGAQPFPIAAEQIETLRDALGDDSDVRVVDGAIYLGPNPTRPQVGDYRIRYELVPLGTISVIGQQRDNAIAAYSTQAGDSLLIVDTGNLLAQEMFDSAASSNRVMTWVLRAGGLVLLIAGFSLMLGPISVVASVIPFLGSIVGMGTGLVAAIAGITLGTLTIGSAWLFYRPLTAVLIFIAGAALTVAIRMLAKRKKRSPEEQVATT